MKRDRMLMARRYGDILYNCRKSAGMLQKDLAIRAKTGKNGISLYEQGRQIPRLDIFCSLIEACGFEMKIVKRGQ